MNIDLIARIIGMAVFSVVGAYTGNGLASYNPERQLLYLITFTLVGALFGLILTPYITTRPIRRLRALLGRISAETLFASLIGLVIGLLTAALLAFPLSMLPAPFGQFHHISQAVTKHKGFVANEIHQSHLQHRI